MRKVYSYEADRWRFVENANHQYVSWAEPPYEIVFKNSTKYDLEVLKWDGSREWMSLKKGESKTVPFNYSIVRISVKTPKGKFEFDEEGGVVVARQIRQGSLQNDVVPISNDGVIEFRHMPSKGTLENYSIRKVQNPAYQVKVSNRTPYDVMIWLDNDVIGIVKSNWISTMALPSGNHMLYFDPKEEECVRHDRFNIWETFIGPVNGCQMGIIEDFSQIEPSWQTIIDKRRGYAGWYKVEKTDDFRDRMFFWQHFTGPASIEPCIRNFYANYDAEKKKIEILYNTIDYRLD